MDVREKILKTASDLFLKYGLRSVTIDDICNDLMWLKLININYKDIYGNKYSDPYTLVIHWESYDLTKCALSVREGNDFLKFK